MAQGLWDRDKAHVFLAAIWNIWYARNATVFDNNPPNWNIQILHINHLANACFRAFMESNKHRIERWVRWKPPPDSYIKLNSDGSSFGNPSTAGFGGLLRNADGDWIVGFSGYCGVVDNLCAELLALRRGLKLAWDYGYRQLICEIDCLEIVRLVRNEYFIWFYVL